MGIDAEAKGLKTIRRHLSSSRRRSCFERFTSRGSNKTNSVSEERSRARRKRGSTNFFGFERIIRSDQVPRAGHQDACTIKLPARRRIWRRVCSPVPDASRGSHFRGIRSFPEIPHTKRVPLTTLQRNLLSSRKRQLRFHNHFFEEKNETITSRTAH